jgi:hypothetical protein
METIIVVEEDAKTINKAIDTIKTTVRLSIKSKVVTS